MSITSSLPVGGKTWAWSVGLSILMILAGFLAIVMPQIAGIAVNLLVAWLLIFSAAAHFAFAWHRRHANGWMWELLIGVLYVVIGGYLLINPVAGLASLTLALAIYLFMEAAMEFALSFWLRSARGWGWLLVDGVVTLILAVMILMTWPSSTEWVIGTLVGISMLFSGATRLALTLAARRIVTQLA